MARYRRQWLAERTGQRLSPCQLDPPAALQGLSENQVGYVALPLSVAGPLEIRGDFARGTFYVPLCALEGSLVLSVTRGCYLTALCGGVETQHVKQELSRCPVFIFETLDDARCGTHWLESRFDEIKGVAESTTRYGRLLRIETRPIHNRVIAEFVYDTADAAGQNMVTLATDKACRFIQEQLSEQFAVEYLLESNLSGDKNPAYKSLLHGRGHSVIASCLLRGREVQRVLHASVDQLARRAIEMQLGSQLAGVQGCNLHVANALSAIYLATGQDIACVVENSAGIVTYEQVGDDLRVSLTMPSLTVGVVGGATRLRQQRQNLELLACTELGGAKKLAEIICATALCLEISLAGAVVAHEFAASHARYGRPTRVPAEAATVVDTSFVQDAPRTAQTAAPGFDMAATDAPVPVEFEP